MKEGLQQKSSETSEKKSHKSEIKIPSFNQKQKLSVSVLSQRARQQILPEIDCFKVRNLINDCFKTNKITEKSVILAVKVSFSGLSVVLTTTNNFSAEYLKINKDIWSQKLSEFLDSELKIQNEIKWRKTVVHNVNTSIIADINSDNTSFLKQEIEEFNPELKLADLLV